MAADTMRRAPESGMSGRPQVPVRPLLLAGGSAARDDRLARCLWREGFTILPFEDAETALAHLETATDLGLVVLEIERWDAVQDILLARFLATRAGTPLAVLSNDDDEATEEAVLDRGAHEFLCARRRPSILAKRLRLLADSIDGLPRRTSGVARVGGLMLRLASHRAAWNGRPVPLTLTEFKIVKLLASRVGEEVSYRSIYDEVHGVGFSAGDGPDGFRTNVRSLIRKIRAKFRAIDADFDWIENYPGFGYRWRPPTDDEPPEATADADDEDREDARSPSADAAADPKSKSPATCSARHVCAESARRVS